MHGKLAAYLLDASASKYQISELTASYRAAAAFTCADYPDAGRLADLFCKMKAEITACGEDALTMRSSSRWHRCWPI